MSINYDMAVIGIRRILEEWCKNSTPPPEIFIYPFGEKGTLVKGVLNTLYGIKESGVVDNKLCDKYDRVLSLKKLKERLNALPDAKVLIAHDNRKTYDEVREMLYSEIDRSRCAEVFESHSWIEAEATKKLLSESRPNHIYPSKKTKSVFYLPDCKTDFVQGWIYVTDNYFQLEQLTAVFDEFAGGMLKIKSNGKVFLDVGANIGSHTMFFVNELSASSVYSFEPIKQTFDILQQNVLLNHAQDIVHLYNCGCGDVEITCDRQPVNFYSRHNCGSVALDVQTLGDIKIVRLDDLKIKEKIFFMKVDVEGMELTVLRGASNLLERDHPYILVEAWGESIVPIKEYLRQFEYNLIKVSMGDYLCY